MTRQRIYLVEASTQYALTSTFLRFQEHYESPKFRGKIFSLDDFMDWYAEKYGNFSYYQDWGGFNIPSSVLKPFQEGKFNPLSAKENKFLKLFEKIQEPFYIIGVNKPFDLPTLKHEFVHGLFYTDEAYRDQVLSEIKTLNIKTFEKALKNAGYHPAVYKDETNAYATTGVNGLVEENGLSPKKAKPVQEALKRILADHFKFSLPRMGEQDVLNLVHRIEL